MSNILAIIAVVVAIVYAIIAIIVIRKKKTEAKVRDVLDELSSEAGDNQINMRVLPPEWYFINKFNIQGMNMRIFVWTLRVLAVALMIISVIIIGWAGLALCGCIIGYFIMDTQLKNKIAKTGIDRIEDTVSFINSFAPQLAGGHSARQAFLTYIQQLPEEDLIRRMLEDYVQAKSMGNLSYKTPAAILDITAIYEIAVYNEEKGVRDYLYTIEQAKDDLFQKSEYYNEYKTRCQEVLRPIEFSYYIGIPVIFLALFGSFSSFWFTFLGAICAILIVVLFLLFKWTINRLNINTLEKIM